MCKKKLFLKIARNPEKKNKKFIKIKNRNRLMHKKNYIKELKIFEV